MSANPFEEGQRVYVAAPALKKLLGREPAEGELYRTVRTIHPEQPERWVMLDWPFHWFEVADVTPLHDNPPRPKWGPTFYGDSNETHKYPSITEVIEEAVTSGEVEKVWASVVEHEKVVSEQALRDPPRFTVDGKQYVLGPCVGDTTYPRRALNVGDLVAFYSHEWKAAKVVDRKNPRMCRNGWDFYLEGEGDRAFSRDDICFLDPFVEAE